MFIIVSHSIVTGSQKLSRLCFMNKNQGNDMDREELLEVIENSIWGA